MSNKKIYTSQQKFVMRVHGILVNRFVYQLVTANNNTVVVDYINDLGQIVYSYYRPLNHDTATNIELEPVEEHITFEEYIEKHL